ncbi:FAD-dependent monooxygenase [Silicimonas sp. MF1-12-2]|uniref:FAD-dependent monooxygenase n=1 Tax=Silicimonas sp. MF1-12-2 TaxID=3384793 RepID=UPI0039B5FBAB
MTERYDVLINGGGPVGMGLAIELGQRGIRTCVVERNRDMHPIPKGQNLTQRTCEHFRAWHCEDEVRAAHPIPEGGGIGGMTSHGTLLSEYTYDWLNRAKVKDYYFAANARLPQYATERVLRARAAELQSVTIRYGWAGDALDAGEDGARLTIANRETGQSETLEARFLVGTDGSRSMVRDAAGIGEHLSDHNKLMALLVFRSEELHELLKRYPGKAFYCVLNPEYEGYWLFFGRVDHGLSWFFHAPLPPGTTRENFDFEALLHKAVGQKFDLEIDHIGLWDLRVSMARTYRKGPVFIAGDAAHSHPPYGGYGINTGFEDVRNLGWKLAAVLQGWGGDGLLDSYDAERRPVFASTARDFIERYIEDDRAFLAAHDPVRDKDDFEKAWFSRNLDADEVLAFEPNYEGSPIIPQSKGMPSARGSHSFAARPGHLLPPPGPDGREAGKAIGPEFTVLAARPERAAGFTKAAKSLGVPLSAPASMADWHQCWGREVILVRPDRYVAWTGDNDADADRILRAALGS